MSINKTIVSGRLTRDAELRTLDNGTTLLKFGVAVTDYVGGKEGANGFEEYVNFFNCTMFGNRAAKIASWLTKGVKVVVEGRLHYSAWVADDGRKRNTVDITVQNIEFMSQKNKEPQNNTSQAAQPQTVDVQTTYVAAELMQDSTGNNTELYPEYGNQQQQPNYNFYGDELPF